MWWLIMWESSTGQHSHSSRVIGSNHNLLCRLLLVVDGVISLRRACGLVEDNSQVGQSLSDPLIRKLSQIFPLATLTGIFLYPFARSAQVGRAYSLRRSEEHTSELQSRGHRVCR